MLTDKMDYKFSFSFVILMYVSGRVSVVYMTIPPESFCLIFFSLLIPANVAAIQVFLKFYIISTQVSLQNLAHDEYIASALPFALEEDYILGF